MTCVVGMLHESGIFIGADSEINNGSRRSTMRIEKVVQYHNMLIGVCGPIRLTEVLHNNFTPPQHEPQELSPSEYMTRCFTKALRDTLRECGHLRNDAGVESMGNDLLIGYAGHLFTIEHNFQLIEYSYPYAAIGSGEEVAMGAFHALAEISPAPLCVLAALTAAEELACHVRSPFHLYHLPAEGAPSELDIDTLLARLAPHAV